MNETIQQEIGNIAKQIISKYKPQKLILFGSAAREEWDKDSDLDFLVIKQEVPYLGRDRARALRKLIDKRFPADFFIYRPDEFEERLKLGDPFIRVILKEGKVLYG